MSAGATCPGCGLPGADEGPTPPHLAASAECWAIYRTIVASEYRDPERWVVRSLTLDAYGAQHPGGTSRQATEATGAHLIGLCLALERGLDSAQVGEVRSAATDRLAPGMTWLTPPSAPATDTVGGVVKAPTPAEHRARVQRWATAVWESWHLHHDTIRHWIDWLYAASPPTLAR